MKKRSVVVLSLCLVGVLLIAVCFFVCDNIAGNVSNVEVTMDKSVAYSESEIKSAMKIVKNYFSKEFEGCTLTKLYYDDEYSTARYYEWAKQYEEDEAIVLLSSFDVDKTGGDGSLNPGSTYENWNWILTRSNGGEWTLRTWGY